jgi:hypothetical protein
MVDFSELKKSIQAQSFVYFIEAEETGFCKIGHSLNPKKRLAELQVGSHAKLNIIATVIGGKQKEQELHARFKSCKHRGEWFSRSDDLSKYLLSLRDFELWIEQWKGLDSPLGDFVEDFLRTKRLSAGSAGERYVFEWIKPVSLKSLVQGMQRAAHSFNYSQPCTEAYQAASAACKLFSRGEL